MWPYRLRLRWWWWWRRWRSRRGVRFVHELVEAASKEATCICSGTCKYMRERSHNELNERGRGERWSAGMALWYMLFLVFVVGIHKGVIGSEPLPSLFSVVERCSWGSCETLHRQYTRTHFPFSYNPLFWVEATSGSSADRPAILKSGTYSTWYTRYQWRYCWCASNCTAHGIRGTSMIPRWLLLYYCYETTLSNEISNCNVSGFLFASHQAPLHLSDTQLALFVCPQAVSECSQNASQLPT